MIKTNEIEALLDTLQGYKPEDFQSTDSVRDHIVSLTSWLAWTAEQMAKAGKAYNIAKRDAYIKLQQQYSGSKEKLSPMLAKDYVASLCSKEAYAYELAERANRSVTHSIDAFRSVLSSLKEEQRNVTF